jgi:LysM repeat protein
LLEVKDTNNSFHFNKADGTFVKSASAGQGLRLDPVSTIAEMSAINAKDFMRIEANTEEYQFKIAEKLTPAEIADANNISDDANTGKWVKQFLTQVGEVDYIVFEKDMDDVSISSTQSLTLDYDLSLAEKVVFIIVEAGSNRTYDVLVSLKDGYVNGFAGEYNDWHTNAYITDKATGAFDIKANNHNAKLARVEVYQRKTINTIVAPEDLANTVTVTFAGGTVNGGKTVESILEGHGAFSSFVDLPVGKMLDTVTNAEIVNPETGQILYSQAKDGGDFTVDIVLKDIIDEKAFVLVNYNTQANAVVEFTADRDMYVLTTWNGTGWRGSAQWGWLDTKYSGATLMSDMKGKCLLYLNANIHQTLLPDSGYFFVKKGDTAKFWLEKTSTINVDDQDRSNIVVREIARRASNESERLQTTDEIDITEDTKTSYTLTGKKIHRIDLVGGGKITLLAGHGTDTVTYDPITVGEKITIEYYN